ncbi:MAG: hypothetical protein QM785_00795 [Pyrinomonadaceae bacterium]
MRSVFLAPKLIPDTRRYNYGPKLSKGYDWIGPTPGELIGTSYLKSSDGSQISATNKYDLILLTVVDPACPASKASRDQMEYLSRELKDLNIDYNIATFSPNVTALDMAAYVKSLTLDVSSVTWTSEERPAEAIQKMVSPSHILIDSKGEVIQTFPGTSVFEDVRLLMVKEVMRQIRKQIEFREHLIKDGLLLR